MMAEAESVGSARNHSTPASRVSASVSPHAKARNVGTTVAAEPVENAQEPRMTASRANACVSQRAGTRSAATTVAVASVVSVMSLPSAATANAWNRASAPARLKDATVARCVTSPVANVPWVTLAPMAVSV